MKFYPMAALRYMPHNITKWPQNYLYVVYPSALVSSYSFLNNMRFLSILQVIKLSIQNSVPSEYTEMVLLQTNLDKVDATQKVGPTWSFKEFSFSIFVQDHYEMTLGHMLMFLLYLICCKLQLSIDWLIEGTCTWPLVYLNRLSRNWKDRKVQMRYVSLFMA
jgi:hypothetical protein